MGDFYQELDRSKLVQGDDGLVYEEQLHEREKTIMDLQKTIDDKDNELDSIRLEASVKEDFLLEQNKQHLEKIHDLQEHLQEKEHQLLKSKKPKHEDGVDMMSKLPDDVLQKILSNIPTTEEVIRTSILSTRWRYVWTSVPSIDIDHSRRLNPSQEFNRNKFKEFVNRVLVNKKPMDLDSFRLSCAEHYRMSTIRRWIDAAVMRKVKLLDLMFCPLKWFEDGIELPNSLVTCGSLEVLKLCLIGLRLSCPKFTGLIPALRVVELREVDLYSDNKIVKYFLESCPMLEDLSLIDCKASSLYISSPKLKSLRIDTRKLVSDEEDYDVDEWTCLALEVCCPKLEFLKLTGYAALRYIFKNLHSLKKAVIHPKNMFLVEEAACNPLLEISHVEYLSINSYFISVLCLNPDPEVNLLKYCYLKTLEITVDANITYRLIEFLKCLPDMESLHLIIPKNMRFERTRKSEEVETMSILTRHLKKVEFLDFNEKIQNLYLAHLLLGHGNELEEMVFSWGKEAKFHKRSMKTMNKVSKFDKASSTVKLIAVFNPTHPNYLNQFKSSRAHEVTQSCIFTHFNTLY